jgi:hypothetical protein
MGLRELTGLTALASLSLSHCKQMTGVGFDSLSGLTALSTLDASSCDAMTSAGVRELSSLTSLKTLNLDYNLYLSVADIRQLSSLTSLTSLKQNLALWRQSRSAVATGEECDESLLALSGLTSTCTSLTRLDMNNWETLTDKGWLLLISGFAELTTLGLSSCPLLTDTGLRALRGVNLTSMHQPQRLQTGGCKLLTDASIQALSGVKLTSINLTS